MPNLAEVLKAEITRLAKKQAKAAVAQLRADVVRLKRDEAEQKRQIAALLRESAQRKKAEAKCMAAQPVEACEAGSRQYMTGKGVRSLRSRLGVTQQELAKLADVSAISVFKWEQKPGKLTLRGNTLPTLLALKGIGAKEARRRLGGK